MRIPPPTPLYKRHRFPAEILRHGVWLSFRFSLRSRDVQEMMAERGVIVSHEALITYLTKQGIVTPKLQLRSGHATEQSLAVYRTLALSDVAGEYEAAMQHFPVR